MPIAFQCETGANKIIPMLFGSSAGIEASGIFATGKVFGEKKSCSKK